MKSFSGKAGRASCWRVARDVRLPGLRAREPGCTSGPLRSPVGACHPLLPPWPAGGSLSCHYGALRPAPPAPAHFDHGRHFDNAQLPYRWVPGLEVHRLPAEHYRTAPRLEVAHTFDWTPGPLWLYGAPGSGVWWDPGRRVLARNMAEAAVRWHGVAKVAAALRAQAAI